MDLVFDDVKPAKAVPVIVVKDSTDDGGRSQVFIIIEFRDAADQKLARKRLTVSDGVIAQWVENGWVTPPEDYNPEENEGLGWPQFKFKQLWDAIPEVPENVLNALESQLPAHALKRLWS